MKIVRTVNALRSEIGKALADVRTIGLVPTMGALHAGHRSLVERARRDNDFVVVSVFVNPTQFNNADDLATYPRTEAADVSMLEGVGVDLAFIPTAEEVYGSNGKDDRIFDLGRVAEVMEGAMRPGHFNGVAQIVSRLFEWTTPTRAYFGEKDFQQIAVIRRMAATEGFDDIDIVACPIVREADGLALSSRNVRLSSKSRELAPMIHQTLTESLGWKADGLGVAEVIERVVGRLNGLPDVEVEYYEIVDGNSLEKINDWTETDFAVGCITVYFGDVRLIDNIKY